MLIDRIKKYELCIGCGLCESVLGTERCKMEINTKGFYIPVLSSQITNDERDLINQLCPGIHIETDGNDSDWGSMKAISEAWASESEIRYKAASGGVVSSLAIYLLEQHKVDAILQVGVGNDNYLYNELKISRCREDVLSNAQSRYAPALVFNRIFQILNSTKESYAFIGKPCDIAAVRNIIRIYPNYASRIKYCISIFCAGIPSYEATIKTWQQSGRQDEPIKLKYRGDGWPGNFMAEFCDGCKYELSYNESWGTVLHRYLPYRCKICPDGIGMLADVAVGDSWNTKDGYPDFADSEGRCFCMIRTDIGLRLMSEAYADGYIISRDLELNTIEEKQPYQYQRRKYIGWRLMPLQLLTFGMLKFKGLGIMKQARKLDLKEGINNMNGSLKRIMKIILNCKSES